MEVSVKRLDSKTCLRISIGPLITILTLLTVKNCEIQLPQYGYVHITNLINKVRFYFWILSVHIHKCVSNLNMSVM